MACVTLKNTLFLALVVRLGKFSSACLSSPYLPFINKFLILSFSKTSLIFFCVSGLNSGALKYPFKTSVACFLPLSFTSSIKIENGYQAPY